MAKRYIKKETVTVSRQQEVFVVDEEIDSKNSKLQLVKKLVASLWAWFSSNILNINKGNTHGDSNN